MNYQPAPTRRGVPAGVVAVIAIVCLLAGLAVGCAAGIAGSANTAAGPDVAVSDDPSEAEEPTRPDTIPGDGTFRVPQEVKPGTYRTGGGETCYWARLRNLTGETGGLIANGVSEGPVTVTIKSTDKGFKTSGCVEWRRVRVNKLRS